jgi:oligopeptide/dipeptide ABC transporter ATP-binding protein
VGELAPEAAGPLVRGSGGEPALSAHELVKHYPGGRNRPPVRALRGVSLDVRAGETYGIVGESGCGKSTLARLLVGLEPPTSGSVEIGGQPVDVGPKVDRRALARRIQLVFQDPFSSLDPRLRVEQALAEVLHVHGLHVELRDARVAELLDMVALGRRFADRYPHELSGGQAQRVAIARALAAEPQVLVLDEPTSALDVSVRAEIMNLLVRIQDELGLSYLFISHDLSMVRHISDDIAVMYLGLVVEAGRFDQVLDSPLHPYTRALADAVPVPDPEVEEARRDSSAPTAHAVFVEPAQGCPYSPRCPLVEPICREIAPVLLGTGDGHVVSCHVASRDFGAKLSA